MSDDEEIKGMIDIISAVKRRERDAALEEAAVFADLWGYGWVAECIRDAKTGPWHLPIEEVYRRSLEEKNK